MNEWVVCGSLLTRHKAAADLPGDLNGAEEEAVHEADLEEATVDEDAGEGGHPRVGLRHVQGQDGTGHNAQQGHAQGRDGLRGGALVGRVERAGRGHLCVFGVACVWVGFGWWVGCVRGGEVGFACGWRLGQPLRGALPS